MSFHERSQFLDQISNIVEQPRASSLPGSRDVLYASVRSHRCHGRDRGSCRGCSRSSDAGRRGLHRQLQQLCAVCPLLHRSLRMLNLTKQHRLPGLIHQHHRRRLPLFGCHCLLLPEHLGRMGAEYLLMRRPHPDAKPHIPKVQGHRRISYSKPDM